MPSPGCSRRFCEQTFHAFCFGKRAFTRLTFAMQAVLDYLKQNQARFVAELCELLRFPSVSAQPSIKRICAPAPNGSSSIAARSDWRQKFVRPPAIPSSWPRRRALTAGRAKHRPHFMVYGHYDVQPPEPLDYGNRRRSNRASRAAPFLRAAPRTTRARSSRISKPSKPI